MAESKKQVPLRLSSSLYDELARWAEDDFRSINGQIEYLLSECVKKRKRTAPKTKGEIPDELNERFVFTYPDGHREEFENVRVFIEHVIETGNFKGE